MKNSQMKKIEEESRSIQDMRREEGEEAEQEVRVKQEKEENQEDIFFSCFREILMHDSQDILQQAIQSIDLPSLCK